MKAKAALRLLDLAAWGVLAAAVVVARGAPAPVVAPPPVVKPSLRRFTLADWKAILVRAIRETQNDQLTTVAGGVTFSALLAIFPALAAFVSLYGLFADVDDVSRQIAHFSRALPPGGAELIGDQMVRLAMSSGSALSLALGVSLILALWSANSGMGALFTGLNAAYGLRETRPWWKRILVTLACTAAALTLLIIVTTATTALPAMLGRYGYELSDWAILGVSWIVLLSAVIAALAGLYRFGPNHGAPAWRTYWPGSVAAALLWVAGSVAFSTYVGAFGHYEKTYGSLGAVIGFMLWIWCSILAVLAGAELNAEIEKQPPSPQLARAGLRY